MGKALVSLADVCQARVIQQDFLQNKCGNLERGESTKKGT